MTKKRIKTTSENAQKADESIAKEPTRRHLLKFTLPTILSSLMMSTFGIVDGIFVSRLIDPIALSAVNIVFPFMSFVMAFGFMMGVGGNALVAKKFGEGRDIEGRENFSFITLMSFIGAIVIAITAMFCQMSATLWRGSKLRAFAKLAKSLDGVRMCEYNIYRKYAVTESFIRRILSGGNSMIGYMTAKEKAKEWGVSERMVQVWCKEKMIDGVSQFGSVWAIPEDAVKPTRTINQKPGRKTKSSEVE